MISHAGRKQLASLTDEELNSLIRALPGLATSWAKAAGTDAQWLGQGRPRALGALRVAMTRRNDQFLGSLARAGLDQLPGTVAAGEIPDGSADRPAELAAAAGKELGAVAGCIFLSGIAASDVPLAVEVAGRLAELRDIAIEGSRPCSGHDLAATADAAQPPPAAPAAASQSVAALALLARTQALRQAGAELADALRAAAADVDSGKPVMAVADDLRAWSAAVAEQLSKAADVFAADDLATLSQGLADIVSKARQEDKERREALRGAVLLRKEGLGQLVPGMLQAAGYGSLEELQAIVDAAGAGRPPAVAIAADVRPLATEPSELPSDDPSPQRL